MSPTTLLISECTDPLFHEITLTPTIPVRKNSLWNFLSVTFYLPKGLWLVNKEKCSVQLEGTNPVTVKVGATCTTLYGLKKFSVITPKITNPFGSRFWGVFGLPTIWVCICEYYIFASISLTTIAIVILLIIIFMEEGCSFLLRIIEIFQFLKIFARNPKTPI